MGRLCRTLCRWCRLLRIHFKLKKFQKSKLNAIRLKYGLPKTKSILSRACNWICDPFSSLFTTIFQSFSFLVFSLFPQKVVKESHMRQVFKTGTKENKLLRRVMIFFFGLLLSWLAFLFIYYQLEVSRINCIIYSVVILIVLTLFAPFYESILCILLLMLPTLFSSKTRFIIVGYIFLMIYRILIPNLTANTGEFFNSIGCGISAGAHRLNTQMDIWVKALLQPFNDMIETVKQMVKDVKRSLERLSDMTKKIRDMFKKFTVSCDTPSDKDIENCESKLNWYNVKSLVCDWSMSAFSDICQKIKSGLVKARNYAKDRIEKVINRTKEELYFEVDLNHKFEHTLKKTKEYTQVLDEIKDGFGERHSYFEYFENFKHIQNPILLFISFWVLINAILYRYRYLHSDAFDNSYINRPFLEIDRIRVAKGKESLIPLKLSERKRYIDPWDLQMTVPETIKMFIAFSIVILAVFQVAVFLLADYLLFVILDNIKTLMESLDSFKLTMPLIMKVEGDGWVPNMVRSMAYRTFNEEGPEDSFLDCKPSPLVPDFETYMKIGNFLILILITVLTESYGLRLRHIVAAIFYPHRIPIRAVWLYNNILCSRADYIKITRRQLRRQVFGDQTKDEVTILDRICAHYSTVRVICKMVGLYGKYIYCIVCGHRFKVDESHKFKSCRNNCKGVYCFECFDDLNNLCTLCMNPIDYGDFEDMSEEHDSSDEDIFYFPKSEDYVYQYNKSDDNSHEDDYYDDYDPNRSLKQDLVSIAYSDDMPNKVPSLIYLVNDEDLGYDAEDEQIVPKHNLSQLERELNIPRKEIIRMKKNAKQFVDESNDWDKSIVRKAKKERLSTLKKDEDQRIVRNSLLMMKNEKMKQKNRTDFD